MLLSSKTSIILILSLVIFSLTATLYLASSASLNQSEPRTRSLADDGNSFSNSGSSIMSESQQYEIVLSSSDGPFYMTQPLIFSVIIGLIATLAAFIFFKFWKKRVSRIHQDLDEDEADLVQ